MTATLEPPRDGVLLPGFALPRAGGGMVRARAYRNRRALALFFVHAPDCAGCRAYLTAALDRYAEYAEQDGEVIAVIPSAITDADAMRRELGLPFPIGADEDGAVCRRFGLTPGADAAAMATDRYGEPRLWSVAGADHTLPDHDALIAEMSYLAMTCSAGCAVPVWQGR